MIARTVASEERSHKLHLIATNETRTYSAPRWASEVEREACS